MHRLISVAATISVLLTAPALAQSNADRDPVELSGGPVYWSGNGWTVYEYPDEGSCDLTAHTGTGDEFTIGYAPELRSVILTYSNQHAKSLGHKQRVPLDIVFLGHDAIHSIRSNTMFTANARGDDGAILVSDTLDLAFLRAYRDAEFMGLKTSNSPIGGIRLSGSSLAVSKLVACGEQMAGIDPKDPFIERP